MGGEEERETRVCGTDDQLQPSDGLTPSFLVMSDTVLLVY